MENVIIETWNKSSKGLTLPAGTYIIGYRAGGTFLNEIYISSRVDTADANMGLYEKELHFPMTCQAGTSTPRTINNVMIRTFTESVTLYFWIWPGAAVTMDYEIWALKIK